MALPRPQEERWSCGSAAVALLLLQALVPCCPPRHVPRTLLCLGRDTSPPWTSQHENFPPRPRHSREWPANLIGSGGV